MDGDTDEEQTILKKNKDNSDSLQNAVPPYGPAPARRCNREKGMPSSRSARFSDTTSRRDDPSSVRNSAWRATYPVSVCASAQGGQKMTAAA